MGQLRKTDSKKPIEFKPDEINGRSTALQRNELQETFNKAAESFRSSKFRKSNSLGRPSVDQMFATSICGSLNFDDEDFQSGDLMTSRMKRDEKSYYEQYAHIPNSEQNKNESGFDGTINQNSVGNFFVNENSLLQNLKSPPTTVNSHFALLDLTNDNTSEFSFYNFENIKIYVSFRGNIFKK